MAEEKKLQVFPVGITEKEIKKIADQAIADSGAANEVPLATQADAGKILKVSGAGAYELAEESTGTNVVANPVLAGTEADLTGLQVGDTKYKIAAGGSSAPVYGLVYIYQTADDTLGDLIEAANFGDAVDVEGVIYLKVFTFYPQTIIGTFHYNSAQPSLEITSVGDGIVEKYWISGETTKLNTISATSTYYMKSTNSPDLPSTDSLEAEKTYVLKVIDGSLEWVEETAS